MGRKNYKLSQRSKLRLSGIDKTLMAIIEEGIKKSPYDFGIPKYGGLRTKYDQKQLYKQGLSQLDGYRKKSYHQSGKAFDIYIYNHATKKAEWDKDKLEEVARHLQNIAIEKFDVVLEWGGDWKSFYDGVHFQMK